LIKVSEVVKEYPLKGGNFRALDHISFTLEKGERIALLGHNGSGKSTLIRLLGGTELPTSGVIDFNMRVSWPIGLADGLAGSLTGTDNIRFISRIHGVPFNKVYDFVADFSELGPFLYEPVRSYSAGMVAKLFFGLSLAIEFDCYLIDELFAVGDVRFQQKCRDELFGRNADKSFIIATHHAELAKEFCSKALVLKAGRGKVFSDVEVALEIYRDSASDKSGDQGKRFAQGARHEAHAR